MTCSTFAKFSGEYHSGPIPGSTIYPLPFSDGFPCTGYVLIQKLTGFLLRSRNPDSFTVTQSLAVEFINPSSTH
jgi:hypothetical protein